MEPMLADKVDEPVDITLARLEETRRWAFTPKWDGHRCIVSWEDRTPRLLSRRGSDITASFPEITRALRTTLPSHDLILDGELIVLDETGRPALKLIQDRARCQQRRAMAMSRAHPATYVVFDLLHDGTEDIRRLPYRARIAGLELLAADWSPPLVLTPSGMSGTRMMQVARQWGLEGLVAKRLGSPYQSGRRSPDWIKLKLRHRVSAVVCGLEPGEGGRAGTFGALRLGLYDEQGHLVEIGKVGSGFAQQEIAEITQLVRSHVDVIVEVEFLAVVGGKLREPVFKGIRPDVKSADCTVVQQLGRLYPL